MFWYRKILLKSCYKQSAQSGRQERAITEPNKAFSLGFEPGNNS
jgi:hypothetical protein